MRLFPAQPSRRFEQTLCAGLLLLSLGASRPVLAQGMEIDVDELQAWAAEKAAESRTEQVEVRFGPLTERLRSQGQLVEAIQLLETWHRLADGASPTAARRLAEIHLEHERFQRVVDVIDEHRAQAGSPVMALELALSMWELGCLEEAEREFRVAMASPESDGAALLSKYQWARFLAWSGRSAESWTQYGALLTGRLGSSADVVLGAARACNAALAQGACDAERALSLAQRTVDLLPNDTGAHYNLVRAFEAAGEKDKARAASSVVRELLAADQDRTRNRGLSQAKATEAENRLRETGAQSAYDLLCGSGGDQECLSSGWRSGEEWLALARVLWAMDQRADALMLLERLVATHSERGEWRRLLFSWRRVVD